MATYNVPLTGWANITVKVEVPDDATPEQIAEAAMDAASPSLCHKCADSRNDSLEIGDVWDPVYPDGSETPEVYRLN